MLEGANTTISIAHRLSTIQRSDLLIVIGSDGKVAQTGTYKDLAADKEGAFAKLMEWQMSGGSSEATAPLRKGREVDPELTEEERMKLRLEEHDHPPEAEAEAEEGVEEEAKEKTADVRAGESESEKKQ